MESISIFDIFKIGVGPSSSHTLGPWRAALDFLSEIQEREFDNIQIYLYGSLSKTGKGHATDKAVQLGLMGYDPKTIPTDSIYAYLENVRRKSQIIIHKRAILFDPDRDIIFTDRVHNLHPNTLQFRICSNQVLVHEKIYASVGGGFIEFEGQGVRPEEKTIFPFPINKGADLLHHVYVTEKSISELVLENECTLRPKKKVEDDLDEIIEAMINCVYNGCLHEGTLPGGLQVKRRAAGLFTDITGAVSFSNQEEWEERIRRSEVDYNIINKWVSCFALAANEENASLSRVVTSPTNGAAGVIPAVMLYYYFFCDYSDRNELRQFLLTAGEVGCLFKKGATISAAVGGCQAEIGVSSAMAAAGLTEVLGGSARQCLMAAEIAMEHNLGLTCDPIGGLVQIPCIERNAMGAAKAITAANLALSSDPDHAIIHIDAVIKTMWETAQDMHSKYKETSEGGLALNLPVVMPNC